MREDVPVGMAVIGAFLLVSGHRPMPGLILATVSTVYFLLLRFYVMEEAGSWWFPNMYKELWADGEKGFKSVVKTLLTNPLFTLNKLIIEKKLVYLMHLLVPIAFLPVRRWYLWAAFIPGTVLTLLVTNYDPPVTFSFHYVMHWAPYLFMASVVALKMIRDERGAHRMYAAAAAMVASTLVLTYNYGAFTTRNGSFKGQFNKIEFTYTEAERARYAALRRSSRSSRTTPRSLLRKRWAPTCRLAWCCTRCVRGRSARSGSWRRAVSSSSRRRDRSSGRSSRAGSTAWSSASPISPCSGRATTPPATRNS